MHRPGTSDAPVGADWGIQSTCFGSRCAGGRRICKFDRHPTDLPQLPVRAATPTGVEERYSLGTLISLKIRS